ncbi:MAG: hypothetical protein EP329_26815 [Deltaproteobacteria bacterium]|nr:MAG: hypothetical protein EP329_26815 [Deltaproteobacteria bacterium]
MAEDQDLQGDEGQGEERPTLRGMSDAVRKAVTSGIRGVLGSEEWVRSTIREVLPKELVTYMKRQADSARDEVVRIIGAQTKRFFEGIDVSGEVQKILTALSFEVKTEVRFIPNDQKVKPDIKVRARAKRADRADRPADEEKEE